MRKSITLPDLETIELITARARDLGMNRSEYVRHACKLEREGKPLDSGTTDIYIRTIRLTDKSVVQTIESWATKANMELENYLGSLIQAWVRRRLGGGE